jgi:hypothetical protein
MGNKRKKDNIGKLIMFYSFTYHLSKDAIGSSVYTVSNGGMISEY